ncbi:MAG: YncE family protein [Alphaproteobacteria bacterium]|nr:YncE family protein [Alphaproteobacteria bacterium]MBV9692742.1 YncE family protein [Alphaproteobacteria bacterium]
MKMHTSLLGASFALAFLGGALADTTPASPYSIVRTISLGAGERWDYVTFDPASGRVYVAHGDRVTVVDGASGARIGDIAPLPGGTHGIAVTPDQHIGYTDDGKAGIAAAFDPATLKIVKTIAAAPDADGIIYDPASGHVFVIDGDSGSITVIDPKANAALQTISIGAGLEAAVADGKGHLYVDGAEQHDIVVVDTRSNTVAAHYAMAGCERPHGIAVDAAAARIFATCINKVMVVVDANSGAPVATLPIGAGSDGAAFDPVRRRAFSSNSDGTLTVVEEKSGDNFSVLANVPTARGARTIALDPKTGRVFLPVADIARIDPPEKPGGRPHVTFVPGTMKLLVLEPAK